MRLGIDFGTTRTVVAAADRGNYPVISFDTPEGGSAEWFPSLVAVRGDERVYGWDAWVRQGEPDWTVVRSIKRVLENAGPRTILRIGDHAVVLFDVVREMAASLRAALVEHSSLQAAPGEKLEVMLGVPANSNSNQRFMTTEAFRAAGFEVAGLLNEPSAASVEFGHRNRAAGLILVYDLGGGTFDASLVEINDWVHDVVASEGIATLGGDDFDHVLAEMALEAFGAASMEQLSAGELFRLHEECRHKKEALRPNARKITVDLEHVRDDWGSVAIPVADYYARCRPMVEETLNAVNDLLAANAERNIDALYVTGGGSELPLIARVLKEDFGRRVRRSAYTRSATAIGLAIQADVHSGYILREQFTRNFGVWREAEAGHRVTFDPLFAKGTLLPPPGGRPLSITRSYSSAHNIGHFRYLECSQVSSDDQPAGDITVWDEILFPFDPSLRDRQDLENAPVHRSDGAVGQRIEERYACDSGGAVAVTIANLTAGYERQYRLGRWAANEAPLMPGRKRRATAVKKQAG